MRKVISVIVENEHGVLARIVNLFAGRGYNIESLTVAPIPESEYSRMTIATEGDPKIFEQIAKQLNKLIPVYKVMESDNFIEKEMAMVKFPIENSLSDTPAPFSTCSGSADSQGGWSCKRRVTLSLPSQCSLRASSGGSSLVALS
jgi:acetolactate synthase-1/3 small subunit